MQKYVVTTKYSVDIVSFLHCSYFWNRISLQNIAASLRWVGTKVIDVYAVANIVVCLINIRFRESNSIVVQKLSIQIENEGIKYLYHFNRAYKFAIQAKCMIQFLQLSLFTAISKLRVFRQYFGKGKVSDWMLLNSYVLTSILYRLLIADTSNFGQSKAYTQVRSKYFQHKIHLWRPCFIKVVKEPLYIFCLLDSGGSRYCFYPV
ncbi:hypothetical protein BY458DRAFT_551211 [Sporodiniella umbellata]|nr:hypothetical protein BY458DRAFT_551211 [Sporodiniella umbellata]